MGLESLFGPLISQAVGPQLAGPVMGQLFGTGGGGQGLGSLVSPGPQGPQPTGALQRYAKRMAKQMFGPGHWGALNQLVSHESSWDPQADNPDSSAYGLFQFLDSTAQNYGGVAHDPFEQIRDGLAYIADRYKNPSAAWNFWQNNNWY